SGFDWGQAMAYERLCIDVLLKEFGGAESPESVYKKWLDASPPANFHAPSQADIAAAHKWFGQTEAALRLAPDQARAPLKGLQSSISQLHPLFQASIPNIERVNQARAEVASARQQVLQRLASHH